MHHIQVKSSVHQKTSQLSVKLGPRPIHLSTTTKFTTNMPVKTDEKKQHFDDIYVKTNPVPYKTEILDKLEYVSDNFNLSVFNLTLL